MDWVDADGEVSCNVAEGDIGCHLGLGGVYCHPRQKYGVIQLQDLSPEGGASAGGCNTLHPHALIALSSCLLIVSSREQLGVDPFLK